MNLLSVMFVLACCVNLAIQVYLIRRHIRHIRSHQDRVPDAFRDRIALSEHRKAADYTSAGARTRLVELSVGTIILLGWTLGGGLQLLDGLWRTLHWGAIWTGTGFMLSVIVISSILDLPLSVYRTFSLEQRFGFNKTTVRTFILDLAKNFALLLVLGIPLLALVLWIMQSMGNWWWLYVWITWLGFSLLMMWAYPAFIAPLFNKFRPLEDAALQQRIEQLLARNGFATRGIFVMDGSSRSSHGNAYFTGLGTSKRIVFFDTLMDELNHDEVEAVLAHELGHFKCRHIRQRVVLSAALSLLGLALLGWLGNHPWFYQGLGVASPSSYTALILFVLVSPVFSFFLQPVFAWLSRRHEFQADDFAATQARAELLIQALVKLYQENASTLTPDPLYSAFHDSHPPAPVRIAHLAQHRSPA